MRHRIVPATEADQKALGKVIADAFADLAPPLWLVADPQERAAIFPGYFRLLAGHALVSGVVHTTPDLAAAALWLPGGPGSAAGPADYDARLAAIAGGRAGRFRAFDAALQARHPADLPHMYLAILAVRPDRQGQGIGTALLDAYHQVLDQDAKPAYLEASDLRTRPVYLHHGYVDHGPPLSLPAGPMLHPMVRSPRPPSLARLGRGDQMAAGPG